MITKLFDWLLHSNAALKVMFLTILSSFA